jgi:hypothetical protein
LIENGSDFLGFSMTRGAFKTPMASAIAGDLREAVRQLKLYLSTTSEVQTLRKNNALRDLALLEKR